MTLTAGNLSLTSLATLAWAGTLIGTNQLLVDTTATDRHYSVNDANGSAPGGT